MSDPRATTRGRRLRRTPAVRDLVGETRLDPRQLIEPVFVTPGTRVHEQITSLPGVPQTSPDVVVKRVEQAVELGLRSFLLFGTTPTKDPLGRSAAAPDGPVPTATRLLRDAFGDAITILADVCLCAYTTHGHCGVLDERGRVANDATLPHLAQAAVAYAEAGADWVAPSDMMDGRVAAIRGALDQAAYPEVAVLSYAVKYRSAFYGPFRDAQGSAPQAGDRSSYQMDPRNAREALRMAERDVAEGADALIVKPGLAYLDVLARVRERVDVPVVAFSVSGEYAAIKAAASAGVVDEAPAVVETLTALRRAGAGAIITYYARQAVLEGWI